MIKRLKEKIINKYPTLYNIEISTRCNLKCIMCEYRYWTNAGRDMSFDEFKKVYSKIPWISRVFYPHLLRFALSGIGEAFMNKDALKIMEFIKKKNGFITLADNFTLITEKTAEKIIDIGVDEIFISLDGATKEVYEKIRLGANFDKVIKNIRYLVFLKKKLNKLLPKLVVRFVPMKENIHELPLFINLVESMGLNEIEIPALYTFEQNKDLNFDYNDFVKFLNEAEKIAADKNIKLNVFKAKQDISECARVKNSLYIICNGEILPCCALNQRNIREEIEKYSFGNIYKNNIAKIWNSDRYKKFRNAIIAGKMPKICEGCYWYNFSDKSYSVHRTS